MVQYYYVCHRELWFFAQRMNMNYEDNNINIGKQIQKESYSQYTSKDVLIDNTISIDIIPSEKEIHEVKKTSIMEKPAKMQLKYYLYYLEENKELEMEGVLKYPRERKQKEVSLTEEDKKEIENTMDNINKIINKDSPPEAERKSFCENCSFYNLCWV